MTLSVRAWGVTYRGGVAGEFAGPSEAVVAVETEDFGRLASFVLRGSGVFRSRSGPTLWRFRRADR